MAHNGQTKSLGTILWRVLRNPLCSELTYEEAAEYALEFIRLLGAPLAYEDKIATLNLTTYKVELPCDLIEIRGVRYSDCNFESDNGIAMRYASHTFHLHHDIEDDTYFRNYVPSTREYTYIVQKGILVSSQERGQVQIAYKGILMDENSYPLIPDNEKVSLALEYFILHRYLEPLWMMGKITDKAFQYISQQRDWYFGASNSTLTIPSVDQMETIMNGLNRLIINTTAHENFFKQYGEKEVIKKYR